MQTLSTMPAIETNVAAVSALKLSGYGSVSLVFIWLGIPEQQFAILGMLMAIDFATGVGKAWKTYPPSVTSFNMWMGAMKKAGTACFLLAFALVLKGINVPSQWYVETILSILIMAEGYSIMQNVYAVRTGVILPEFDVLSKLIKLIGAVIKGKIETALNRVDTSEKPENTQDFRDGMEEFV